MRTIKKSCLERVILFGEGSVRSAASEFTVHYHAERNHQGLGNKLICPQTAYLRCLFQPGAGRRREDPVRAGRELPRPPGRRMPDGHGPRDEERIRPMLRALQRRSLLSQICGPNSQQNVERAK